MSSRLFAAAIAVAVAAAACSSSDGDATTPSSSSACVAHDASKDDLTKPVSFATDVVPVLQKSCGLSSSCHGSTRAPLLGTSMDAPAIHDGLVGRPSRALPSMPFVTASKPDESFLMHKLDGDTCMFDAECTQGTCGDPMPLNGQPMAADTRAVIRRWIAQGAKAD